MTPGPIDRNPGIPWSDKKKEKADKCYFCPYTYICSVKTNIFLFPPICCKIRCNFCQIISFQKRNKPAKIHFGKINFGGKTPQENRGYGSINGCNTWSCACSCCWACSPCRSFCLQPSGPEKYSSWFELFLTVYSWTSTSWNEKSGTFL